MFIAMTGIPRRAVVPGAGVPGTGVYQTFVTTLTSATPFGTPTKII